MTAVVVIVLGVLAILGAICAIWYSVTRGAW